MPTISRAPRSHIFNHNFPGNVLDAERADGRNYIDVMNVHYFSTQQAGWANYGPDLVGKVAALREVMRTHGLGVEYPVMVTEMS